MRLFDLFDRRPEAIIQQGLILRQPSATDYSAWKALRAESAGFLIPWEPRWPRDDLTWEGFRRRLRRYRRDSAAGDSITWFLFREADQALLGGLTYSGIRHGAARSAQLGYWMGERHAGRGYMSRAVRLSLGEMFGSRGIERIEAACVPGNERSVRLLEGLGFKREGYMRGYLEINGERRDHHLYALLRHEFPLAQGVKRAGSQPSEAPAPADATRGNATA